MAVLFDDKTIWHLVFIFVQQNSRSASGPLYPEFILLGIFILFLLYRLHIVFLSVFFFKELVEEEYKISLTSSCMVVLLKSELNYDFLEEIKDSKTKSLLNLLLEIILVNKYGLGKMSQTKLQFSHENFWT